MVYYETYYPESELYHWGIKGMKWGVRRYQNEDGTLTEAGKKRYGTAENYNEVQKTKAEKKEASRASKEAKRKARDAAREERVKIAIDKAIKSGDVSAIMKHRSKMTSQQLRDAYERAATTARINELDKRPGVLESIARKTGKVANTVNAVASAAESFKRLSKAFKGEDSDEKAFDKAVKEELLKNAKNNVSTKKDGGKMSIEDARKAYKKALKELNSSKKSELEKAGEKAGHKVIDFTKRVQEEAKAKAKAKKEKKKEKASDKKYTATVGDKTIDYGSEDPWKKEKKKKKKAKSSVKEYTVTIGDRTINYGSRDPWGSLVKHSEYSAEELIGSILVHHGIKGQKWGVRRYQNEDGTLTNAGRKRYLSNYYVRTGTKHINANDLPETKSRDQYIEAGKNLEKAIDDYENFYNDLGKKLANHDQLFDKYARKNAEEMWPLAKKFSGKSDEERDRWIEDYAAKKKQTRASHYDLEIIDSYIKDNPSLRKREKELSNAYDKMNNEFNDIKRAYVDELVGNRGSKRIRVSNRFGTRKETLNRLVNSNLSWK